MPLSIGLAFDLKSSRRRLRGQDDSSAEFDTEETISSVERALSKYGHSVCRIGSARRLIGVLPRIKCDIVFNIAEGMRGRNRESQVPAMLEARGIPYVGSDALTLALSLDKAVAKKIFAFHGIPTPSYFECVDAGEVAIPTGMGFPLIVKPRYEGSAKGITPASKVGSRRELKAQARRIIKEYAQPALVEEFISGTEFTVGIIGNERPLILPPAQRHLEVKTNLSCHIFEKRGYDMRRLRYGELRQTGAGLEQELKRLALAAFRAVECRDFARVDMRVRAEVSPRLTGKSRSLKDSRPPQKSGVVGGIYLLEINPLPSLARDDYFALSAECAGISYEEMINEILKAALERRDV